MEQALAVLFLLVCSLSFSTAQRPAITPATSEQHINLDVDQRTLPLSFLVVSDSDGNINSGQAQSKYLLNGVTQVCIDLLRAIILNFFVFFCRVFQESMRSVHVLALDVVQTMIYVDCHLIVWLI